MIAVLGGAAGAIRAADFSPAAQEFSQEIAVRFGEADGLPAGPIQLLDRASDGQVRAFAAGKWFEFREGRWQANDALRPKNADTFTCAGGAGLTFPIPWREARQVLRAGPAIFVATATGVYAAHEDGSVAMLGWPQAWPIAQIAISPQGLLHVASGRGLYVQDGSAWKRVRAEDSLGRAWGVRDVLGVAFDSKGQLWFAVKAGVGCRSAGGWRFFEGKDGLPWNDFTGIAAGTEGDIWFTTHLGVIRFDGVDWQYRQGYRWLPNDDVVQALAEGPGAAWFATAKGVGRLERRRMTLAEKAEYYEREIERYVKRTPYGYVAEAALRRPGDKSSADPQDSDNDGLWTSMYGAGECFAYAATKDPKAKGRAKQAFEALRFLQKVTQGCEHSPPKGYIARTIRPIDWPDPNVGRLQGDLEEQKHDRLWKAYEPRWPKSADGRWFWKSDTSSDELDGHCFFYPLYYDYCADTDEERERVREVVRDISDHFLAHGFNLVDFDGTPTRWGVYGPDQLNRNPFWWSDRGLRCLSMLSYLTAAEHVTGDPKYGRAVRELIDRHGYAQNAMHPKVQQGPGSGNQSDDEMAFMSFYTLLRLSSDQELKGLIHYSFYRYWINEAPEMNPFFNFAFAAQNLSGVSKTAWGSAAVQPWAGWHADAMATLYGFPLDRLNWAQHNSHRLDLEFLPPVRSGDLDSLDRAHSRGCRVNGKVVPVENRHFNHWNTDPWELDYGGNGNELAAGTVFLLPYYMGLYHGYIAKPPPPAQ
jgi:hypothetical protein